MDGLNEFKIILVGQQGVGKTSLLLRFALDKFYENPKASVGVDVKTVYLDVNGRECLLHIHDTAGQETFWSLGRSFFRSADGVILVYDGTDPDSFSKLSDWLKSVQDNCGDETVKLIAGNKMDDTERIRVIDSSVQAFANSNNLEVIKTSAKCNTNVNEVFLRLIKNIAISKGIVEAGTEPTVEILETPIPLLIAIDESKASYEKERRSRFISKHSSHLDVIRIAPQTRQEAATASTTASTAAQTEQKSGCSC